MRFRRNVAVTKYTCQVLDKEIMKCKGLNSSFEISKAKLIDYAVAKTFDKGYLELLKNENDFKDFMSVYEKNV